MKATDYVAEYLADHGVDCVFELSGGMITHLLDSISTKGTSRVVSMHHEQGAAFAAEGWARMTGVPGVALATSGPGATNLLTGIGSCYFDSTPAVFITGQVNTFEQKGERGVRQLGFQETDIIAMARPITKLALQVRSASDLPEALDRAFETALSGRRGPVLLDIPMDVQRGEVPDYAPHSIQRPSSGPGSEVEPFVQRLLQSLDGCSRPLVVAGGGIRTALAAEPFRDWIHRLGIPVVSSLQAIDVLPTDDPLRVGMLGSYGNRWSNLAVGRSDLLIVLGSRLDIRQTGALAQEFKGERELFQVDVDPSEMNNRIVGCDTLECDLRTFFAASAKISMPPSQFVPWLDEIRDLRLTYPDTSELDGCTGINPNVFMHQLAAASGAASAYVVDVGQHQMWAAQSVELGRHQRFLTSAGMGSMGFALPAAIGAAYAGDPRPVVVIAGDGGFQCNIQELETIRRNRLPVKMVVINNRTHGMVRQFQESYFEGRYQSTLWGYSAPDFQAVAQAYGIPARAVADPSAVGAAVEWLWADPAAPALLEVMVDTFTNIYPKIAFGQPITGMEPDFEPLDMEGT